MHPSTKQIAENRKQGQLPPQAIRKITWWQQVRPLILLSVAHPAAATTIGFFTIIPHVNYARANFCKQRLASTKKKQSEARNVLAEKRAAWHQIKRAAQEVGWSLLRSSSGLVHLQIKMSEEGSPHSKKFISGEKGEEESLVLPWRWSSAWPCHRQWGREQTPCCRTARWRWRPALAGSKLPERGKSNCGRR